MNVAVIGAGAWGTALAITSARGGCDVTLWSYDGAIASWDGVKTPESVHVTRDMSMIGTADVWLIATPSAFFADTLSSASQFYNGQPVIICTKGAEVSTGRLMSEILRDVLPECGEYGVLSGPQFAAEVARAVPTGSTMAGTDVTRAAGRVALSDLYLSETDDIIGAEICGVGKNAVALITGYASVVTGENERAMIFTRAWGDVVAIGHAMGARMETFLDLCGIGDLFLSAASATSRNFSGGMAIAHGDAPSGTVEGVCAISGLISRAEMLGVDVPTLCEMRRRMGL
ncbi:hypothetical protein HDR66_03605 [bacterium]|nr:hypothetical protein [bacterium]